MTKIFSATAAVLLLTACGAKDARHGDTAVGDGAGGLSAPAVGAGGEVNGRGVTDSNAARPAATGGTGVANNNGIGATPQTGRGEAITTGSQGMAGTAGAPGTTGSAGAPGTAGTAPQHSGAGKTGSTDNGPANARRP